MGFPSDQKIFFCKQKVWHRFFKWFKILVYKPSFPSVENIMFPYTKYWQILQILHFLFCSIDPSVHIQYHTLLLTVPLFCILKLLRDFSLDQCSSKYVQRTKLESLLWGPETFIQKLRCLGWSSSPYILSENGPIKTLKRRIKLFCSGTSCSKHISSYIIDK